MGELTVESERYETPRQLLSRFYFLQEERVQTYLLFEEGFKAYLKGAPNYNFPMYRQLVHEITQTFSKISAEILSIHTKFADQNNLAPLAEIIQKIQDAEKIKLEVTAKLQMCQQKQIDEPANESNISDTDSLKHELQKQKEVIVDQMEELKFESEELYTADNNEDEHNMEQADSLLDR